MVKHNGKITDTITLDFAGPSTFSSNIGVSKKGEYEIIVYAFDPQTGNSGVDKVTVQVN